MERKTFEKKDGTPVLMQDLKLGDIFHCIDPTEDQTWVMATGTPYVVMQDAVGDVWGIPFEKAPE